MEIEGLVLQLFEVIWCREDVEGTTTSIPMGEQKEVEESRIRRASQPYPQRRAEGRCREDHNPHPCGKSEEGPGGD